MTEGTHSTYNTWYPNGKAIEGDLKNSLINTYRYFHLFWNTCRICTGNSLQEQCNQSDSLIQSSSLFRRTSTCIRKQSCVYIFRTCPSFTKTVRDVRCVWKIGFRTVSIFRLEKCYSSIFLHSI
jgi:hypothetical protein